MTEASNSPGLFETATDQEAIQRAVAAAAPTAAERADQAMLQRSTPRSGRPCSPCSHPWPTTESVLGRRYAEWCTGAPMLESAVAAAAMAQDELGRARSFLSAAARLPRRTRPRTCRRKRLAAAPASAMRCLDRRFGAWADFVAANLVVDAAMSVLLASAVDATYEPLRQRARKIQQEETTHWVHATGWARRLPRSATLAAITQVWDDAFTWFGAADDPSLVPLCTAGLLARPPDGLRHDLRARLKPVLDDVGLAEPLLAREPPWPRWDAVPSAACATPLSEMLLLPVALAFVVAAAGGWAYLRWAPPARARRAQRAQLPLASDHSRRRARHRPRVLCGPHASGWRAAGRCPRAPWAGWSARCWSPACPCR